jgi:hypothetical protein
MENFDKLLFQEKCKYLHILCKMLDKLLAFAMDFDCMFAMGKVLCKMHLEMEHFAQTSKTYHFYIYKIQGKILLFSLILIYAKIYIFIETKFCQTSLFCLTENPSKTQSFLLGKI